MTRDPTLLADECEGDRNRIMIWLRPDSQVKIVWIAVDDAGGSLWHEVYYPHAIVPTLRQIVDAGEKGGQDGKSAEASPVCELPVSDGARFRAPQLLLSRALNQVPADLGDVAAEAEPTV